VRDPSALSLPPRERAIAGLAALLTEAPWTVDGADFDRVRSAGVSDEGIVQAVTIAAAFNHLTRVADGTGVEPDYASPLPRIQIDATRGAIPRPARADWPVRLSEARLPLSLRPRTQAAFAAWRAYVREPSAALSARDRAVIGSAAAAGSCDATGVAYWGDVMPATAREIALSSYATLLTEMPWRGGAEALEPLRALGLDDRGLLDVIGLVGTQNMASRVTLTLALG
jgi:alkylhydroperoxidase family enzyme